MSATPTVRVVNPANPAEFITVNASDAGKYQLWDDAPADAIGARRRAAEPPATEGPRDSADGGEAGAATQSAERPADDDTALPIGYEAKYTGGGFYSVTAPGGGEVDAPGGPRFKGKKSAADAAWLHFESEGDR